MAIALMDNSSSDIDDDEGDDYSLPRCRCYDDILQIIPSASVIHVCSTGNELPLSSQLPPLEK